MATKVMIIYPAMGPYHIARLRHLRTTCSQSTEFEFMFISIAGTQEDYPWFGLEREEAEKDIKVLFPDSKLENISMPRVFWGLQDCIRDFRPNFVFHYSYSDPRALSAALFAKAYGAVNIIMSDSTYADHPRRFIKEKIKSIVLKLYSKAFVSGVRSEAYIRSLGLNVRNIVQGVDVVDSDFIRGYVMKNRNKFQSDFVFRRYFICVARLIDKKNISTLIESFSQFRGRFPEHQDIGLIICGDGPKSDELRKQADELASGGIVFLGHVGQPELFVYVSQSLCLILPSKSEQWGLVVNEALAAGTPVLVSEKCGCRPELVLEGQTGWGFEPDDKLRLIELLARVAGLEPADLAEMRTKCLAHASSWGLNRFSNGVVMLSHSGGPAS